MMWLVVLVLLGFGVLGVVLILVRGARKNRVMQQPRQFPGGYPQQGYPQQPGHPQQPGYPQAPPQQQGYPPPGQYPPPQ